MHTPQKKQLSFLLSHGLRGYSYCENIEKQYANSLF